VDDKIVKMRKKNGTTGISEELITRNESMIRNFHTSLLVLINLNNNTKGRRKILK